MTTPDPFDGIALPESWVLAPSTTAFAHAIPIEVGRKTNGNFSIDLPLGANQIVVTWDGSTWLEIIRRPTAGDDVTLHRFPAGNGVRKAFIDAPSRAAGDVLRFNVPAPTIADVATAQCSVTLFHTPPAS